MWSGFVGKPQLRSLLIEVGWLLCFLRTLALASLPSAANIRRCNRLAGAGLFKFPTYTHAESWGYLGLGDLLSIMPPETFGLCNLNRSVLQI